MIRVEWISGSAAHQAQILAKRRLVELVHNELDLRHGGWSDYVSKEHVSTPLGVEACDSMRARILRDAKCKYASSF